VANVVRKIFATLANLRETVTGSYGSGVGAYLEFIYFSLFSLNTFKVYSLDLQLHSDLYKTCADEFTFMAPSLDQVRLFRQGKKLPREFFYDEIHDLKVCHAARSGTDFAYIHWLYFPGHKSRFFHLEEGVVEVNNCHTLPAFRGRNLMTRACNFTALRLKDSGTRHLLMVIHKDNIPSIKSALRAGFREVAEIKSFGPFNARIRSTLLGLSTDREKSKYKRENLPS
jgi:RimJ/RimL family protein N-acetyltransferase